VVVRRLGRTISNGIPRVIRKPPPPNLIFKESHGRIPHEPDITPSIRQPQVYGGDRIIEMKDVAWRTEEISHKVSG